MLIQNISSAASAPGFTRDGGPVPLSAPHTQPVDLPQAKSVLDPIEGTVPSAGAAAAPPTDAQLKSAVDDINRAMKQNNSNVEFSIDKDTRQTVVKIVESKTGTVIRQFPSDEILAISRMIEQAQHGILVRQKA